MDGSVTNRVADRAKKGGLRAEEWWEGGVAGASLEHGTSILWGGPGVR